MEARKKETEFVHDLRQHTRVVLRSGVGRVDSYSLAVSWYERQKRKKPARFYRAYRVIEDLLPVWAEREGVECATLIKEEKKISSVEKEELRQLIKRAGKKLLVPASDLDERELYDLFHHFKNGRSLSRHLSLLIGKRKSRSEFLLHPVSEKIFDGWNTFFLCVFLLGVMLLNL